MTYEQLPGGGTHRSATMLSTSMPLTTTATLAPTMTPTLTPGYAVVVGSVIRGEVVSGDARGRQLGFPTANQVLSPDEPQPRDGVYAGLFSAGDVFDHPAAVSIGRRPTFYTSGVRLVESFLLDFSGDLYGEEASVRLVEFLRPQHRFDDVEALLRQLRKDVRRTDRIISRRS
jgi:riboflavin kinase/FMN adenylyltransferase